MLNFVFGAVSGVCLATFVFGLATAAGPDAQEASTISLSDTAARADLSADFSEQDRTSHRQTV